MGAMAYCKFCCCLDALPHSLLYALCWANLPGLCVINVHLLNEGQKDLVSENSQVLRDGGYSSYFVGEEVGSEAPVNFSVPCNY